MHAIVVEPPTPGATWIDLPEPLRQPAEVLVEVIECGICGTDRDIASGKYGTPPEGSTRLILGHENFGRVVQAPSSSALSPGDLVVATVRRGCGICRFCNSGRSDFCETGRFTERGIRGRDGYLTSSYTEIPEYLVRVPPALRSHAVLLEPLSVVEKAILEGQSILDRFEPTPGFPRERPRRALVTGTGAIGMLASLVLSSEGYEVTAIDRHDDATPAAKLLETVGAHHVNVHEGLSALGDSRYDLVLEASGSALLDFELVSYLAPNAVLVLTGIPSADDPAFPVSGGRVLRELVLENQAIVGSVNANRLYFERGITHLLAFRQRWGPVAERLITERRPASEFAEPLLGKSASAIKTVLTFDGAGR